MCCIFKHITADHCLCIVSAISATDLDSSSSQVALTQMTLKEASQDSMFDA